MSKIKDVRTFEIAKSEDESKSQKEQKKEQKDCFRTQNGLYNFGPYQQR